MFFGAKEHLKERPKKEKEKEKEKPKNQHLNKVEVFNFEW